MALLCKFCFFIWCTGCEFIWQVYSINIIMIIQLDNHLWFTILFTGGVVNLTLALCSLSDIYWLVYTVQNRIWVNQRAVNLPFEQVYGFSRFSLRISLLHHKTFPGIEYVFEWDNTPYWPRCARQLSYTYKQNKKRCFLLQTPTILCKSTWFQRGALLEGRSKILRDLEAMKEEHYHFLFFKRGNISAKAGSETYWLQGIFIRTEKWIIVLFSFSCSSCFCK